MVDGLVKLPYVVVTSGEAGLAPLYLRLLSIVSHVLAGQIMNLVNTTFAFY